jgi:hypothetical protein
VELTYFFLQISILVSNSKDVIFFMNIVLFLFIVMNYQIFDLDYYLVLVSALTGLALFTNLTFPPENNKGQIKKILGDLNCCNTLKKTSHFIFTGSVQEKKTS